MIAAWPPVLTFVLVVVIAQIVVRGLHVAPYLLPAPANSVMTS